jgi:hypothetical protein
METLAHHLVKTEGMALLTLAEEVEVAVEIMVVGAMEEPVVPV